MKSGIFFERDGVLNLVKVERGNQVTPLSLDEFIVNPAALDSLHKLKAAGFVLLVIPFLNLSKNPEQWVKDKAIPPLLYGLSAQTWFDLAFLALGLAFLIAAFVHRRRPLPLLSSSPLVKAQLIYLVLLWCMVLGNFERALPSFAPVRLVTEGLIFLNAVLCTLGILVAPCPANAGLPAITAEPSWPPLLRRTLLIACIAGSLSVAADWALVRALYGDNPARYAGKHIRFGPNATATKAKPPSSAPHP